MSSILKQHRIQKQRKRVRKILLRVCIFFVFVVGGAVSLLAAPQLWFGELSVSGNASVSSEEILRVANDMLAERVFIFFPKSNIFLFRPRDLEARIVGDLPLVATASVSRSFKKEIHIDVTERTLWGLYCAESAPPCFYIAEDGAVIAEAPQLTGNIIFRIGDRRPGALRPLVGGFAVEESLAGQIRQIVAVLKERFGIAAYEAVLGHEFKDRTAVVTAEGWYVLFDEKTDINRALESMSLVLERQITDRADLEYIDIRFDGKVFYKQRG